MEDRISASSPTRRTFGQYVAHKTGLGGIREDLQSVNEAVEHLGGAVTNMSTLADKAGPLLDRAAHPSPATIETARRLESLVARGDSWGEQLDPLVRNAARTLGPPLALAAATTEVAQRGLTTAVGLGRKALSALPRPGPYFFG